MSNNELKSIIAQFLRESGAPGPEHDRLEENLKQWAISKNYTEAYATLPGGGRPDVLRTNENVKHLFLGDAKDANNETSTRNDTITRIQGYFYKYADLLSEYKGGIIAIATNDERAAQNWVGALNLMARSANIVGPRNSPPDFKIDKYDEETWFIWW